MVRKAPLDDYLVETLLPDLIGHDRAPSAFLIYLKLWHLAKHRTARTAFAPARFCRKTDN